MRILIIKDHCNKPYMVRLTLAEIFGRELKLHTMLRSDNDRELHDHPWGFWSLILAGGYDEEIEGGLKIARNPGAFDYRPPEWRHRVKLRWTGKLQDEPWPVKLLEWLGRFQRFSSLPQWHEAISAIRFQANRHDRTCCTLVLTTKRVRTWGFWRKGKFVPHDQFKSEIEC